MNRHGLPPGPRVSENSNRGGLIGAPCESTCEALPCQIACFPAPVEPATWGGIKGMYR